MLTEKFLLPGLTLVVVLRPGKAEVFKLEACVSDAVYVYTLLAAFLL